LHLIPNWFAPHPAYALSKYSMSIYAKAMVQEFRAEGIAFNTLWPRTIIAIAAVRQLHCDEEVISRSRAPMIVGPRPYAILTKSSREFTGQHCIDEDVLIAAGVTDFLGYRTVPSK
jgi:citronellol/citronellal dehydrogenase